MKLISVKEVASLLGCCERTVYRLTKAEKIPGLLKVGRLNRWREDRILRWIELGCPEGDFEDGDEQCPDEVVQGSGENSGSTGVPW